MKTLEQRILPGIGLGLICLGHREHEVRAILGEPTEIFLEDFGDKKEAEHNWKYHQHGLFLSFAEEDDYRLSIITTQSEWATLGGGPIIGLTETELLSSQFNGIGPPYLEDDMGETGRDYSWDELSLSCMVDDDNRKVVSVSILPLYDETGQIALWPPASK